MTSESRVFRDLGNHVSCVLQEVGAQLKFHAKQAKNELGLNLKGIKTPFCGNLTPEMGCSLFTNTSLGENEQFDIKTSGNYEFGFNVRLDEKGLGLIIANVEDLQACEFHWTRKFSNFQVEIENFGNCYTLTADDVGATIVLDCTLLNSEQLAHAEIGPIDIDPKSKRLIQDALVSNCWTTLLNLTPPNSSNLVPVSLTLLPDELVLKPQVNLMGVIKCKFGVDYPKLALDSDDPTMFKMQVGGDKELDLRIAGRNRDLVVLMIRVFHARVLLNNSFENNLTEVRSDGRLDCTLHKALNLACLVQKQAMSLSCLALENEKLGRELRRAKEEKNFLEVEMKNTIQVFQQLLSSEHKTQGHLSRQTTIASFSDEISSNSTLSNHSHSEDHETGYNLQCDTRDKNGEEDLYMDLLNRNVSLSERVSNLTGENEQLNQRVDELQAEKNRIEKQLKCTSRDLTRSESEREKMQEEMEKLKAKLRKLTLLD